MTADEIGEIAGFAVLVAALGFVQGIVRAPWDGWSALWWCPISLVSAYLALIAVIFAAERIARVR